MESQFTKSLLFKRVLKAMGFVQEAIIASQPKPKESPEQTNDGAINLNK